MSILTSTDNAASVNGITVKDINLNEVKLSDYNGKVLLIVNVASECMYTTHYKNMQGLYEQYKDKGLEILAFPCNQTIHYVCITNCGLAVEQLFIPVHHFYSANCWKLITMVV